MKSRLLEEKHSYPIFSKPHEIEYLYSMSLAATTFEDNVIHSLIAIPLINFESKYSFVEPILTENEIQTLDKMSKIARRPLDLMTCSKGHQLKLLSSWKLFQCLKTQNNNVYFCNGRTITYCNHQSDNCSKLQKALF